MNIVLLPFIALYYLFFTKPEAFIQEQEIIDEINAIDNSIKVETIEDIVKLDDTNYFVPFTAKGGEAGMGYYRWSKAAWRLIVFESNHFAHVWQLNKNDPTTKYIVWHYPKDSVDQMELYLMKDRYYSISDGTNHYYEPKVQLQQHIDGSKNYGAVNVSDEFADVMQLLELPQSQKNDIFGWNFPPENYSLRLNFLKDNEETYPTFNNGSGSYWTGAADAKIDFLPSIEKPELE